MKSSHPLYLIIYGMLSLLLTSLVSCQEDGLLYKYEDVFDCQFDSSSEYIIVFGDIQEYTQSATCARDFLMPTINWIIGMQKQGYKIDCVLHTGDITNNNNDYQYKHFQKLFRPLADKIPFITVNGNHDYDWAEDGIINDRKSSKLTKYASFGLACDNIVARYEDSRLDNIVVRNIIHGKRYDILALEFGPRPEVIQWADTWVKSHPECNFILLTHEFLEFRGWRISNGNSGAERQFVNIPFSTPEYIWDNLIYHNDNIRCVLCGHNGFSQLNLLPNETGRQVPQIMFNLQYLPNGGNSMIEVWEIPQSADMVKADVFITKENLPYTDYQDSIYDYKKAHFTFDL